MTCWEAEIHLGLVLEPVRKITFFVDFVLEQKPQDFDTVTELFYTSEAEYVQSLVFRDGKFFKDWSKNNLCTVVMKSGVSNSCLALGLPVS